MTPSSRLKATERVVARQEFRTNGIARASPIKIDVSEAAKTFILLTRDPEHIITDVHFGTPAWFALLNLFLAKVEGQRISVTELRDLLSIPTTSAQRIVHSLEENGHIRREQDLIDGRRFNLALEQDTEASLDKQLRLFIFSGG